MIPVASVAFVTSAVGLYFDEMWFWLSIVGWTVFAAYHFWWLEKKVMHITGVWLGGALIYSASDIWNSVTAEISAWYAGIPQWQVAVAVVLVLLVIGAFGSQGSGQAEASTSGLAPINAGRGTPRSRIYLDVPYDLRELAKSAGGRWDADRRKWYATSEEMADRINASIRKLREAALD